MKQLLFITPLTGTVCMFCYEDNWEEYYPDMESCDLMGADLVGAYLAGANLYGANLDNLSFDNISLESACLEGVLNFNGGQQGGCWEGYSGTPIWEGCAGGCSFVDENGDGYDDVSYTSGFIAGYSDGVVVGESVEITTDNLEAYNIGFSAGQASADTNNDGLVDEFPVISIIDGNAMVLIQGSLDQYTDSGASCSDQEEGNLSWNVEVSGDVVNINNPNTYTIFYNCSDSDGNVAQTKHRTVFVVDQHLFVDEDEEGYDDDSYNTGAASGDINLDSNVDVVDIVKLVGIILYNE